MSSVYAYLPKDFDLDHWLIVITKRRTEDEGYAYESVAHDLVHAFGYYAAANVARLIGELAADGTQDDDGHWLYHWDYWSQRRADAEKAAVMFELLGWHQAVLLAAWFERWLNRDEVREHFPNAGGITPLPQR